MLEISMQAITKLKLFGLSRFISFVCSFIIFDEESAIRILYRIGWLYQ